MSNLFRIQWGCIIEKLNHVSSFQKHTSETNTIYSLHSICWVEERKEVGKKVEDSSDKGLSEEKWRHYTGKMAQILTVQWSQLFQVEEVRIDWPNRTGRSRLILFCLRSLSFEGGKDNEPSYMSPNGRPLKLTQITTFVYTQSYLQLLKSGFQYNYSSLHSHFLLLLSIPNTGLGFLVCLFLEKMPSTYFFQVKGLPHVKW